MREGTHSSWPRSEEARTLSPRVSSLRTAGQRKAGSTVCEARVFDGHLQRHGRPLADAVCARFSTYATIALDAVRNQHTKYIRVTRIILATRQCLEVSVRRARPSVLLRSSVPAQRTRSSKRFIDICWYSGFRNTFSERIMHFQH